MTDGPAVRPLVTFYHDVEQDLDSDARPEACREAVRAFLDLERRHGIPATYNVVGKLYEEQPDLRSWIEEAGQEIAFHSYHHHPDWNPAQYEAEVDHCRAASASVRGYRSPRSESSAAALGKLWAAGFLWNAESDLASQPYYVHGGLVRLPVALDDWPLHTGQLSPQAWVGQFESLLRQRAYVAVGMHDTVASFRPEERLALWAELFAVARRHGATVVTFSEAADLFRRASLADYYDRTAQSWNRDTRVLYRTRRISEIVKSVAAGLPRPVVADLGSGGGVVTAPLADASKVYCVDHAPGMVTAASSTGVLEARRGDATASGLPDACADMVVCSRVAEYLFWPEALADEIRRIARPGAALVVTFPAVRGPHPTSNGAPPDRIRRHFSPREIERWAEPIGSGRLMAVQYEEAEPQGPEQEAVYRAAEEQPLGDRPPTNYVWVGRVEHPHRPRPTRPLLDVSVVGFRFPLDRGRTSGGLRVRLLGALPGPILRVARRLVGRARG